MAANSISQENYASIMASYSKDGTLLRQINALSEVNDMLADAPVREATSIDTDQVERITSLPAPYWHKLGEGLTATYGHVQQGTEAIAMLRNQWRGNVEIVDRQANAPEYRARKEQTYLEGMNQEMQNTAIYGDSGTAPEEFDGLDVRYDTITAGSVFDNGGSEASALTTIWLIQWDLYDCCMIFPKGSPGGLRRTDEGRQWMSTDTDATGNVENTKAMAWFYATTFAWDAGACIQDTRRVKCLRNIHKTRTNSTSLDIDLLIDARNAFTTQGTIYAYMAKEIKGQIQALANVKANVQYPPNSPFGKPVPYVLDMPVRQCDAILLTESQHT